MLIGVLVGAADPMDEKPLRKLSLWLLRYSDSLLILSCDWWADRCLPAGLLSLVALLLKVCKYCSFWSLRALESDWMGEWAVLWFIGLISCSGARVFPALSKSGSSSSCNVSSLSWFSTLTTALKGETLTILTFSCLWSSTTTLPELDPALLLGLLLFLRSLL